MVRTKRYCGENKKCGDDRNCGYNRETVVRTLRL